MNGPAVVDERDGKLCSLSGTELLRRRRRGDAGLAEAARLRRREDTVNTERLARLATATRPVAVPALVLNLLDDVVLTAIVERRPPTLSGGHALSGRLQGIDSGTLTLVVNGAVVAGTVLDACGSVPHPARAGMSSPRPAGRRGKTSMENEGFRPNPVYADRARERKTFAAVVVAGRRRGPCAADTHNGPAGHRWDGRAATPCSCGTARTSLRTPRRCRLTRR